MKRYVVITIDVEPDCSPDWRYSNPLTFTGVHEGIGKILQPLFNKYSFTPTYLINNVVLENDESVNTFSNLQGSFELGTHLHPEFIAPQKTEYDYAGKKGIANSCFYPPQIEFEKIQNITGLFAGKFSYAPTSFRAGRFSAGPNTIRSLSKLNYKVDTSVTPNVRWDDRTREKPVDYRRAPWQPYGISCDSLTTDQPGSDILEVPVSIILNKLSLTSFIKYIIKNKRIPYKGSSPLWLRPKFSRTAQFSRIVGEISEKYCAHESVVFNMMFHNVEVMPGLSPYSTTAGDAAEYMRSIEWFLKYCNEQQIQSTGLTSLYDIFKKK
jgi:hypothetical protein